MMPRPRFASVRRLSRLVIAPLVIAASATLPACILFTDTGTQQCESDADCSGLGDGLVCTAEKVCATRDAAVTGTTTSSSSSSGGTGGGEPQGCVSNAACIEENGGLPFICKNPNSGEECVAVQSQDCEILADGSGDLASQDVILIGWMCQLTGALKIAGESSLCATEIALNQFKQAASGLPGGSGGKLPVAVVVCDEKADGERAATHLVENLGVKAIIGPCFDTVTVPVAQNVTVPNDVLIVSGQGGGVLLQTLNDDGLLWTIYPNDTTTMGVLPHVVRDVQEDLAKPEVKVAMVIAGDTVNTTLAQFLVDKLSFNDDGEGGLKSWVDNIEAGTALPIPYGDPANEEEPPDYGAVIAAVTEFEPDIILTLGSFATGNPMLATIESTWPGGVPKPTYVSNQYEPAFLDYALIDPDTENPVRTRWRGIQLLASDSDLYTKFQADYAASECGGGLLPPQFTEGTYDATYVTLYAYAEALRNGQLSPRNVTGSLLAEGVAALGPPGTEYNVGENIDNALNLLASGGDMNLDGVTNSLDWDVSVGSPTAPMEVLCIAPDGLSYLPVGQTYDGTEDVLVGDFVCPD